MQRGGAPLLVPFTICPFTELVKIKNLSIKKAPFGGLNCKLFVKKSEILTFGLQKRLHFAVLVKGLFLTGKKILSLLHLSQN